MLTPPEILISTVKARGDKQADKDFIFYSPQICSKFMASERRAKSPLNLLQWSRRE